MQVEHLLLGQPWQCDRRVKHDGFTNKYSFVFNQRNITLILLIPKQVYGDQMSLQRESEQKKKREKRVKIKRKPRTMREKKPRKM